MSKTNDRASTCGEGKCKPKPPPPPDNGRKRQSGRLSYCVPHLPMPPLPPQNFEEYCVLRDNLLTPPPTPPPFPPCMEEILPLTELFVSCQGKPNKPYTNNSPGIMNDDTSFEVNGCTKVDFLRFLEPRKCKISKQNPSCCPFSPPSCKNGMKYPICSWFASPKYYHHTCSRSTRPHCCRTKCWFYDNKQLCEVQDGKTKTDDEDSQNIAVRKLSSNTLHGVKSVNDLRAWSICCEEQRRYFLEQMQVKGKGPSTREEGEEGQLELSREADVPSDASPMEVRYENLLKVKDEEIERLKNRIRELEGQPERPPPSATRRMSAAAAESTAVPSTSSGKVSKVQSSVDAGRTSSTDLVSSKSGGILAKSKSTMSTKGVTIEDSPPTKDSEPKASTSSIFGQTSKTSLPSQKSGESAASIAASKGASVTSRKASETKSQKSSDSVENGKAEASKIPSSTKSQKSSGSFKGESAAASRKGSTTKSQESSESVAPKSAAVSRKGSDAKSQKSSKSIKDESATVSRKGSDAKSQKSSKSVKEDSNSTAISRRESETKSHESDENGEDESTSASRKGSKTTSGKSSKAAISGKESEAKTQKSSGSVKSESAPVSRKESEKVSQKSSKSGKVESTAVSRTESETDVQESSESVVNESVAASRKESENISQKSSKIAKDEDEEFIVASQTASDTQTQKSSAVSRKESETKSQESSENVAAESSPVSRKGSDAKSQKSSIRGDESVAVSRKGSDAKSHKSGGTVKSQSAAVSRKESEENVSEKGSDYAVPDQAKSRKSNISAISGASAVSPQRSSESIPAPKDEEEKSVSGKPSSTKSQKSSSSGKPASKAASKVISQKSSGRIESEEEMKPSTKASDIKSGATSRRASQSSPMASKKSSKEGVKSSPASPKESKTQSVKSTKSGQSAKASKSGISQGEMEETEDNEVSPKSSKAASRKGSASRQPSRSPSGKELHTEERKDSGIDSTPGSAEVSRHGSQVQDSIPEEDEEAIAAENEVGTSKGTSKAVSKATSLASQQSKAKTDKSRISIEEDEPDLFEDEPEEEFSLDDIHPVTSSEELSDELYFIEPESEGIEVTYAVSGAVKFDQGVRTPEEQESQEEIGFESGVPRALTEEEKDELLGEILPLQSNESLCMELMFVYPPSEESTHETSSRTTAAPVAHTEHIPTSPRIRSLSLAEIGGYEERRPKPFVCSVCDEKPSKPKFPHRQEISRPDEISITIADLDLTDFDLANPYDTRVIIENNKIKKIKGFQVVEELDPEALVAEFELLKEKVVAQRMKITELEGSYYNGPSDLERSQIAALRRQLMTLESELAERDNVQAQWYNALEMANKEKNTYQEEAIRNQVMLREYEVAVMQLQHRIVVLENGATSSYQMQTPPPPQPPPQQQQQYSAYY